MRPCTHTQGMGHLPSSYKSEPDKESKVLGNYYTQRKPIRKLFWIVNVQNVMVPILKALWKTTIWSCCLKTQCFSYGNHAKNMHDFHQNINHIMSTWSWAIQRSGVHQIQLVYIIVIYTTKSIARSRIFVRTNSQIEQYVSSEGKGKGEG